MNQHLACDELDRPCEETDAEGHVTTFTYDNVGNVKKKLDPWNNVTETVYRADDLPVRIEYFGDVAGSKTKLIRRLEYDDVGNVEKETWANGNVVEHTHDPKNRVTKSWDLVGTLLERTYTAWGAVKTENDGEGNETIHHYDDLERLERQELPEDRTVSYTYDAAGNLKEETNARGFVTTYRYLYTFQNPTAFTDPDGRTEVGNKIANWFRGGGTDNAAELAEGVEQEVSRKLGGFAGKVAGIATGLVAGAASAASETLATAVDVADTGVNGLVATVAGNTEAGRNARRELKETAETVKYVVENADEVGAELLRATAETAKGVARGDVGSITRATAAVADAVTGGKGSMSAAGRLSRQAQRARSTLRNAAKRVDADVPKPKPQAPKPKGRDVEPKYCFVAGTLVATMEGLRPIEEIENGDLVWSRDETTGEVAIREVTELFVTPHQAIYEVDVEREDGTVETIGTTAEHPFWVEDLGWVPASRLRAGDRLVSNVGGWLQVRQVRGSPRTETVYNFEVAEYHAYFVGESGVWVHNLCEEGRKRLLENLAENRAALKASQFPSRFRQRQPSASRIRALRDSITDSNGKKLSDIEIEGIRYTIGAVERQGFQLSGAVKLAGNPGIDLEFFGVGRKAGRVGLAEAKRSKGLGSLATDRLGIRQGSVDFFRTRAQRAGRLDLVNALRGGNVYLFIGLARSERLFEVDPQIFRRTANFIRDRDAVRRIE